MPYYRAFPVNIFRNVVWVDIEAPDKKTASRLAIKAAKKMKPPLLSRALATDNGWFIEENGHPLEIEAVGISADGINPMDIVLKEARGTVYTVPQKYNLDKRNLQWRAFNTLDENQLTTLSMALHHFQMMKDEEPHGFAANMDDITTDLLSMIDHILFKDS